MNAGESRESDNKGQCTYSLDDRELVLLELFSQLDLLVPVAVAIVGGGGEYAAGRRTERILFVPDFGGERRRSDLVHRRYPNAGLRPSGLYARVVFVSS